MDRRLFLKTATCGAGYLLLLGCNQQLSFDIKDDVLKIEDFNIPDYYFANNYLQDKIERINTLIKEEGAIDAFIFITDQHWDYNAQKSPLLMHYIQKNTGINRVFCGGDFADYCGQHSVDYVKTLKSLWNGEIHCVVGNHEYLGRNATEDIVAQICRTNPDIQVGNLSRHYYYVDNSESKIRYIVLSSYSQSLDGGNHAQYGYGSDQAKWLKEEALVVEPNWKLILFTHFLYFIGVNDDIISLMYDENRISQILDYYNGPGKIVCMFHGHNHRDRIIRMAHSNTPVIVSTSDKYIIEKDDQLNVVRQINTIFEQAFDVVVINEKNRLIHCVRIGCPAKDGIGNEVGNDVEERIIEF